MTTITSYTKAHIDDLVSDLGLVLCSRKTTHYTLVVADASSCIEMNSVNPNNLIVPANADEPFLVGSFLYVTQRNVGVTTIVPDTGVTIRSLSGFLDLSGQYGFAKLLKIAADEWYAFGDLA